MSPPTYQPQLATLVKAPPSGEGWWHEIKFDGYRIGCRIKDGRITLTSRNGKDWTSAFPEVVEAARSLPTSDALLDGEVAMVLPDGRTSFQALQNASSNPDARDALVFFVFDLLRVDGQSIESRPLAERKSRLQTLLGRRTTGRIRFSDHVTGSGASFLAEACRVGLEGIVSKRLDRPYYHGRNTDWVKAKCTQRQELVVGGFTDPEGTRMGLGALLVGYYDGSRLVFAGKVGTGFAHDFAVELRGRLDTLEQHSCPFDSPPPRLIARRAHWVKPNLVGEVSFTEWTADGMIRHPVFQGLRSDKKPRDVRLERPHPPPSDERRPGPAKRRPGPVDPARRSQGISDSASVAGVHITHADRPLYSDPPITKVDLARYYFQIADWIVPHVARRPLTLLRCPEGTAGKCFFMKHSKTWAPAPLRRAHIQEKTKIGAYLIADDIAGVVALVQMGVLEIHTWNSTIGDVERPNRLVIDLDPGAAVGWPRVVEAARVVRKALAALDLESYCKTTGGRGLHVVTPLEPHADWSACLAFARALSEAIERTDPDAYTTRFKKRGRQNKILIDFLRNNRTNTSIAAFSVRARDHAPVSVPISWAELRTSSPPAFNIATVQTRLARLPVDPWKGYWTCRQTLTKQRLRAIVGVDRRVRL